MEHCFVSLPILELSEDISKKLLVTKKCSIPVVDAIHPTFLPNEANVVLTLPYNSLLSLFITQLQKGQQLQVCQWQEMTAQAVFCSLPQEVSNLASLKDNSLSQIIRSLMSCLLRVKLLLPFW